MSTLGSTSIRRIVTGHDQEAWAIIQSDEFFDPLVVANGVAATALIWTTATVPADNNDATDGRAREAGLTINQGSVIRIVDMLPGQESPMHRTNSIDYGVLLSGKIELELDDGAKTQVGPGDIVIQRGTNHLWRNPSATDITRILFVLIQASAYLHHGAPLAEHKP